MLTATPVLLFPILDEQYASRAFVDDVLCNSFVFNGEPFTLEPEFDWKANPSGDVEWLILLHKFYYAPGLGRAFLETGDPRYLAKWMELTESFIAQVPVDFLPADVAGRRIQNWLYAWSYFQDAAPGHFAGQLSKSLQQQAAWLRANLTPARNHRTLELLALFLMAVTFGDQEQLAFVRQEIAVNLASDFRPDGVHIEQSTDYHHIVLRNALAIRQVAAANGIALPPEVDAAIRRALEFALYVHRPDGWIPSLSDGDTGSYLTLLVQGAEIYGDERLRYVATQGRAGQRPEERHKAFPDGGYYILRSGWGETEPFADERWLVFDCGPLGEGNHGHLDLLSFEFYAYGRALVVDPGRYTYDEAGAENWRVHFRGTGSHNTVLVDGRNQTRYEFHKRKFKIRGPQPEFELKAFSGEGRVRGVARSADYDVVHEREIRLVNGQHVEIRDWLRSPSEHTYDLLFHLNGFAQGHTVVQREPGRTVVTSPHLAFVQTAEAACFLDQGWVSRSYGEKQPAPVVRFRATGKDAEFFTVLYPSCTSLTELTI